MSNFETRIHPKPDSERPVHYRDRYGFIWLVVVDGLGYTRADYAGPITVGKNVADAEIGPMVLVEDVKE